MIPEENKLKVVNANTGMSNVIGRKHVQEIIGNILDNIVETLSSHCGPSSRYALILTPDVNSQMMEIFTKDGANIIHNTNSASIIENYLQNLIKFIGDSVDNVSRDGTTTSMIFAANFLSYIIRNFPDRMQKTGTYYLNSQYNDFEKTIIDYLNNYKFTISDLMEQYELTENQAIHFITWIQTMTSSGGDVELANTISTLFKMNYHDINIESFKFNTHPYETNEKYTLILDNSDFNLEAQIDDVTYFNHELGTEMYHENIDILAHYNALANNDIVSIKILNHCDKHKDKKFLIFVPNCDPGIFIKINELNENRENKIYIVQYAPMLGEMNRLGIEALKAVAMVDLDFVNYSADTVVFCENAIIKNATIHYKHGVMHFYNLYEKDERTKTINNHPAISNPNKHPAFKKLIDLITNKLHNLKYSANKHPRLIAEYGNLIEKMVLITRQQFWIGGSKHEVQAAIDVVKDSIGATKASLKHGIMFGSLIPLLKCNSAFTKQFTEKLNKNINIDYDTNIPSFNQFTFKDITIWNAFVKELDSFPFMKACMYATTETQQKISDNFNFTELPELKEYQNKDMLDVYSNFTNNLSNIPAAAITLLLNKKDAYMHIDAFNIPEISDLTTFINKWKDNNFDFNFEEQTIYRRYPIVQPANMYTELFKRIGDVVVKLICTDKILVPNTVFIEEDDD